MTDVYAFLVMKCTRGARLDAVLMHHQCEICEKKQILSVRPMHISRISCCMDTLYTLLIVVVSLIALAPLVRYGSRYLHSLRKTAAVEISP